MGQEQQGGEVQQVLDQQGLGEGGAEGQEGGKGGRKGGRPRKDGHVWDGKEPWKEEYRHVGSPPQAVLDNWIEPVGKYRVQLLQEGYGVSQIRKMMIVNKDNESLFNVGDPKYPPMPSLCPIPSATEAESQPVQQGQQA